MSCSCKDHEKKKELLPVAPSGLAGLVDYAPKAIVSRTIAETAGGTLTVFAFAEGQGLSEHSAPFDALVNVLDGEGEFIVGGTPHRVQVGQILRMPAGIPHAVRANQPFKMMLIMLRGKEVNSK
jgi:quercetin dioxygenase-like cupin family protein